MEGAPVREGDVLAGKYRIERVLGVGGMGVVVSAMHMQLDQRVALKFLHPEALENKDVVARFAREARAAAKIQSEHVARVVDVGTLETGSPYMVMEYLEGRDLGVIIEERGAIPVEEATGYVLQACEAIAEAHAAHIVHRDLKPANLFLAQRADKRSIVKVLDFGISKSTGKGEDVSLTRTSSVMGSPLYMSPEQMASAKMVDQRSDIWAIGVILYELVTGVPPFVAESMTEVIASILMHTPVPPANAPPGLVAAITKCLEKEPARRFQTVAELAVAIAPFAPPAQQSSVEKITRVLGGSVRPPGVVAPLDPRQTAPLVTPAPGQPPPPSVSVHPPSAQASSAEAIHKLAVAKTHASWGRTGDEAPPAGKGRSFGLIAAVGVVAALTGVGVVALRKPEPPPPPVAAAPVPPPVSAPAPSSPAPAPAVPAAAASGAPADAPASSARTAPAASPSAHSSKAPRAPASAGHAGSPAAPPRPAASSAPAPSATTTKNPLQIDLK